MPAKGWKKPKPKSKEIKLRLEPAFAERVVKEAGKRDGNVSAALRTAALVGLDAIDRRRKGLDQGGRYRVEMTSAEEATRDQQRRYADAAMRRRVAAEANTRELTEKIVAKLRERPGRYTELLYGTMKRPSRKSLRAALDLLTVEGRINTVPVGAGMDGKQARLYALATDGKQPAATPRPTIRRVMDEVMAMTGGTCVFTTRALADRLVVSASTLAEALAALLAEGTLQRVGRGVYEVVEREEAVEEGVAVEEGSAVGACAFGLAA